MTVSVPDNELATTRLRPEATYDGPLAGLVQQLVLEARPDGGIVIGVTSAVGGEGKTAIAIELAHGLGLRTRRNDHRSVLVVDCHLASEKTPRRGWKFWRKGASRLRFSPEDFASVAPFEYRSLTSVLQEARPAGGAGLHHALGPLRNRYAFIVLDMPALLDNPSRSVVAREADHLYLVVRADSTDAGQVQHAIEQLDADLRERIDGVILNQAHRNRPL